MTRIEGRFTAAKYLDILQIFFLPSLQEKNYPFPPGPIIFVQDRCPIHTARAVREWFGTRDNLELLDWLSKGCDCNPIENVWANIVNMWEPENERTPEQLMAHTQAQWDLYRRNNAHQIRTIVSSMPDRIQAVIEKEGGWTHY